MSPNPLRKEIGHITGVVATEPKTSTRRVMATGRPYLLLELPTKGGKAKFSVDKRNQSYHRARLSTRKTVTMRRDPGRLKRREKPNSSTRYEEIRMISTDNPAEDSTCLAKEVLAARRGLRETEFLVAYSKMQRGGLRSNFRGDTDVVGRGRDLGVVSPSKK